MIKAIGAGLIIAASGGFGFQIAKAYRDRPKQIADMANALRILRTEVEFSLTPLPTALERVGRKSVTKPVQTLFLSAAQGVGEGRTVVEAFATATKDCQEASSFRQDDLDAVREFASTLGVSDLSHQSQHFDTTLARLSGLEREARDLQRKNEWMWQYLGVLFGLLIVVIVY